MISFRQIDEFLTPRDPFFKLLIPVLLAVYVFMLTVGAVVAITFFDIGMAIVFTSAVMGSLSLVIFYVIDKVVTK
jgi:hypothetical protein